MTLEKGHSKAALLLIAIVCCRCYITHAAKITTKATNDSAVSANATSIELLTATAIKATKTTPLRPFIRAEATASNEEEEEEEEEEDDDEEDDDDDEDEADGDTDAADEVVGTGAPATALAVAEKNAQAAAVDATSALSFWGIVRNVWSWIKDDLSESLLGDDSGGKPTAAVGAPATALAVAEKNAQAAAVDATSALSFWGIVRNVWSWIKDDLSESLLGDDSGGKPTAAVEGRTFGKIRRLQMALIPLIFKFGILSAMVAFLVMLGMKTLFLVKLLVLMNAAAILAKFLTIKTNFGHVEHVSQPTWSYSNWNPHVHSGWAATAPAAPAPHAPTKEIHLHIHGGQVQPQAGAYTYGGGAHGAHGWESRSDPYGAYAPAPVNEADIENELNNVGPLALLPTKYPTNHRSF